jgi:hypothetical protein
MRAQKAAASIYGRLITMIKWAENKKAARFTAFNSCFTFP